MRRMIPPGFFLLLALAPITNMWAPSAQAHENYTNIFNFDGIRCCNGHDCQLAANPKDFTPVASGYVIKSTGEFVPLNSTGFSPDASWHICRREGDHVVRCLLVPNGGF